MKVRFPDLEEALRDPSEFFRNQGRRKSNFGPSRYLTLRSVGLGFHKDNDIGGSVALLEQRLRKFKTARGNDSYVEKLREYVFNFQRLGTTVARVRNNVKLPLRTEDFQVTGQIARLDVDPAGGYRAWLLTNKMEEWRDELRFPLIQVACASQLDVDVEEVVPGVYDFSTGQYTALPSDKKAVQRAQRRLLVLLDELRSLRP